jgi:hypothetical protein
VYSPRQKPINARQSMLAKQSSVSECSSPLQSPALFSGPALGELRFPVRSLSSEQYRWKCELSFKLSCNHRTVMKIAELNMRVDKPTYAFRLYLADERLPQTERLN